MLRFTDEAKHRALEMIKEQGNKKTTGVRIRLKINGCQLDYIMNWEDALETGDQILNQDQLIIYMDPSTSDLLNDAVVEYLKTGDQEGFVIRNQSSACSTCKTTERICH
ncbi:iron-sulfur cluster biosynthesis family protein [Tepidibacillus marianensis]|uniref:HesB/IscA family protein n=1 Tax=Tepidibacillus marianensis TaxID=3131995 RepID=UPI0030D011A2